MKFWFGQEDERRKEERDERKRKYNVKWNEEVFSFIKLLIITTVLLTHNYNGNACIWIT